MIGHVDFFADRPGVLYRLPPALAGGALQVGRRLPGLQPWSSRCRTPLAGTIFFAGPLGPGRSGDVPQAMFVGII